VKAQSMQRCSGFVTTSDFADIFCTIFSMRRRSVSSLTTRVCFAAVFIVSTMFVYRNGTNRDLGTRLTMLHTPAGDEHSLPLLQVP
jgi:hypothetical protein